MLTGASLHHSHEVKISILCQTSISHMTCKCQILAKKKISVTWVLQVIQHICTLVFVCVYHVLLVCDSGPAS